MHAFETLSHLFHPRRSNNHRPRVLHPEVLVYLGVVAFTFFALVNIVPVFLHSSGGILGFASSISASDVVNQTNQRRATDGLGEVTVNGKLNQAALSKAQHMFANQYWAHIAPDGTSPWVFFKQSGYGYVVAGENLARDFNNTSDMLAAWMASPTHRANIMNGRFKEIGVAVVNGTLQGTETTLVVQLFGTLPAGDAQISDTAMNTKKPAVAGAQKTANAANTWPQPTPTMTDQLEFSQIHAVQVPTGTGIAQILGGDAFRLDALQRPPLFSPLQLAKAFFLALIFMLVMTLTYDTLIMSHRNTVRLVGKNFAHILFFAVVAFLIIFFKSGVIG